MAQWSKNAFVCHKCPEKGCPMWWETVATSLDGEVKIIKSCGFTQLPTYLIEVVKASNRPAAAVESARDEIAKGFGQVSSILGLGHATIVNKQTGYGAKRIGQSPGATEELSSDPQRHSN
jgi:hypothetical protein